MEQLLLSTKIWNRHFICALLKRKKNKNQSNIEGRLQK